MKYLIWSPGGSEWWSARYQGYVKDSVDAWMYHKDDAEHIQRMYTQPIVLVPVSGVVTFLAEQRARGITIR